MKRTFPFLQSNCVFLVKRNELSVKRNFPFSFPRSPFFPLGEGWGGASLVSLSYSEQSSRWIGRRDRGTQMCGYS
jgi:hypothetical protein